MNEIFGDLDSWAWLVSGAALTACISILGLDFYYYRLKLPIRSRAVWMLLGVLVLFCAAEAVETLSNASDAPHKVIVGEIPKRREV
jgi:hypothetical protein